jgi:hypothetical protein
MRIKVLCLTILALVAMLVPTSGVFAATDFWTGTASIEKSDPLTVEYVSSTDGTIYNIAEHAWVIPVTGSGVVQLVLRVTNNDPTANGYTLNGIATPSADYLGKVTAAWMFEGGGGLAKSTSKLVTLTVTTSADAPIGSYAFALKLQRTP